MIEHVHIVTFTGETSTPYYINKYELFLIHVLVSLTAHQEE